MPRVRADTVHTHGMARQALIAATLTAFAIVTACTGRHGQPAPRSSAVPTSPAPTATLGQPPHGEVHGRLLLDLFLQKFRPVRGTVTIDGPDHRTIPVGADGRYSATLAPGVYRITGHSPIYGSNTGTCIFRLPVTITTGSSLQADVRCLGK
jgi:hypothetical protein